MSVSECPECGQTYRPSAGHCRGGAYGGCCTSFAAQVDFDEHRVGDHASGQRRCLTHDERLAKGWLTDTPSHVAHKSSPEGRTLYWASPKTLRSRARMAARKAAGLLPAASTHSDSGDVTDGE